MKTINRKALTPLMTTFLLLSFAVAGGVIFVNFGRAEIEDSAQCAIDVNLEVAIINQAGQICYNSADQELEFTINNGVNLKIEGLLVNIIGTDKAESFELNEAKMPKAGSYVGHLQYNSLLDGAIRQIKIIPKIIPYDVEVICPEKALIIEAVTPCSSA